MYYSYLVFAHILGVFGFLIAHGASAAVAFKLRGERALARIRVLLELSRSANTIANVCLFVVLAAGITAGFMGNWWGQFWIWTSLGLLILLSVFMTFVGSGPLIRIRKLLESSESSESPDDATEKQVVALLDTTHPMLLAVIGGGGLAIILWLMMFKPF